MNIFVLDYDIAKCASFHNDRHCVKMLLESAQMLSTACRISGVDCGYKATHINHPCNKWVRASLSNWFWLRDLVINLNAEWRRRFNHQENHKSFEVAMILPYPKIKDIGLTKFALAMPEEYKCDDVVQSYRKYYIGEKRQIAKWSSNIPWWWI
jgi:hypothetical protein